MQSSDFLFTWNPDKWRYAELKELINKFEAGEIATEHWRCQAHRQVRPGHRAYLFKQGTPPRGVFAIAEIIGPAEERGDSKDGEGRHVVPLRFEVLFDPTKRFIIPMSDLANLPAPPHRWNTQASGVPLEPEVARAIDAVSDRWKPVTQAELQESYSAPQSVSKQERLAEVYQRDQTLVDELKRLYAGRCQICGSIPFAGHFGSIAEGHHIVWLCRGGDDTLSNLMLLCPNHHAAVHATDPAFDWEKLAFRFGPKLVPVRLDLHLKRRTT